MAIMEKIEDLKTKIENHFLTIDNIKNYNFTIGKPEIFDDVNLNVNLFPLICFTNIKYLMETEILNAYDGKISLTLIISDVSSEKSLFSFLDINVFKEVLKVIREENDVLIKEVEFDDNIENIYSLIANIEIYLEYSI